MTVVSNVQNVISKFTRITDTETCKSFSNVALSPRLTDFRCFSGIAKVQLSHSWYLWWREHVWSMKDAS